MTSVFQRVVVPVEFEELGDNEVAAERSVQVGDSEWVSVSTCTTEALALAARVAAGADVYVVHATHDFRDYATWMPPSRIDELNAGASRHTTSVLEAIAVRHCPGVMLHYVIRPGKPLDVILTAAKDHAANAIVLAASPRSRVARAFLGSTADKVIRQSSCPVIVVPSGAH